MKSFMEEAIKGFCAADCTKCRLRKKESCEIADCVKGRKKRFCGECESFPCENLKKIAVEDGNDERIERCRALKAEMVKKASENVDMFGVCGHHCDFCFLRQWCGGCRSEYNCCSYATLFENGVCPNVSCAKEKGLDSCAFCDELPTCSKGTYGDKIACSIKAKALFIKNEGKTSYLETLKKAISEGEPFEKPFMESESVESAYKLLESYMNKAEETN